MRHRLASLVLLALVAPGCGGCGGSETLFTSLAPDQTGVAFENRLEESAAFNIISYLYYYNGGGVAAGDVDGDGRADLYFTANEGPNALYLNRTEPGGPVRFEDATEAAGVAGTSEWTTGVAMADVDGDGRLDLYVSALGGVRAKRGRNELFLNEGPGPDGVPRFREAAAEVGLDFEGYGTQAAFVDYDRDGDLDVYLLNHAVHSERSYDTLDRARARDERSGDRLYRNETLSPEAPRGPTRFTEVTEAAGIRSGAAGYGLSVVATDADNDGWPDLYVGNDFHENDFLYLNNRDGTFREIGARALRHSSRFSMGADAADVDGDGRTDFVVMDMLPGREAVRAVSGGEESRELAELKRSIGYLPQVARNTLQLNRGPGPDSLPRYSDVAYLAGTEATDWSWSALLADLDLDGRRDLFITNGIWRRPNDLDFINYASNEAIQRDIDEGLSEENLDLLEPDAAGAGRERGVPQHGRRPLRERRRGVGPRRRDVLQRRRDGRPGQRRRPRPGREQRQRGREPLPQPRRGARRDRAHAHARRRRPEHARDRRPRDGPRGLADGSRRGVPDARLPVVRRSAPRRRARRRCAGRERARRLARRPRADAHRTFPPARSRSGRPTPARPPRPRPTRRRARGRSLPTRSARLGPPWAHRENTFEDFGRERLMPHALSTLGPALAVGDVNGDGARRPVRRRRQAATLGALSPDAGRLRADSARTCGAPTASPKTSRPSFSTPTGTATSTCTSAQPATSSGGRRPPSATASTSATGRAASRSPPDRCPTCSRRPEPSRQPTWTATATPTSSSVGASCLAEYGAEAPESALLLNDGRGRFRNATAEWAPEPGARRHGLVVGLDRRRRRRPARPRARRRVDGADRLPQHRPRARRAPTPASQTPQAGGPPSRRPTSTATATWTWCWATSARTRLPAPHPDHPARLWMGDFNEDTVLDALFTVFRDGDDYPIVPVAALQRRFPALRKRYPTTAAFGARSPGSLFGAAARSAEQRTAATFASAVAVNDGAGRFALQPLPDLAQVEPVYALLAGDVTRDGATDVLLGGGLLAVPSERGRYDAGYGLLLRGDGRGSFRTDNTLSSGLVLDGEVRALRWARRGDGTRLLVAARNNLPLQVFEAPR